MAIGMVLVMVGLIPVVVLAWRGLNRTPAPELDGLREHAPLRPALHPTPHPHYEARLPAHFSAPPVTIETIPPAGLVPPGRVPGGLVPAIDRSILAALASSGTPAVATRPQRFPRGSNPRGLATVGDDLDDAETLRGRDDLDDDAATRTTMEPVA